MASRENFIWDRKTGSLFVKVVTPRRLLNKMAAWGISRWRINTALLHIFF
jgi:hypothetical protein